MVHKLVQSPRFNRRVTVLKRGTPMTNTHNEEVEGTPTKVETWAAVTPAPGTERFASAEMAALAPMRFVFRWRDNLLTVKDSIRFDGHDYAVSSVTEIGTREGIEVLATARAEVSEE